MRRHTTGKMMWPTPMLRHDEASIGNRIGGELFADPLDHVTAFLKRSPGGRDEILIGGRLSSILPLSVGVVHGYPNQKAAVRGLECPALKPTSRAIFCTICGISRPTDRLRVLTAQHDRAQISDDGRWSIQHETLSRTYCNLTAFSASILGSPLLR